MKKNMSVFLLLTNCMIMHASTLQLDSTFNASGNPPGTVVTQMGLGNSSANGVAVQTINGEEKIVTVGFAFTLESSGYAIARYNSDGTLDETFGDGGRILTNPFERAENTTIFAVKVQPDQKIVVAGAITFRGAPNLTNFALARYNADGTLDTQTFNPDGENFAAPGTVTTDFASLGYASSAAYAITFDEQGNILLAGEANLTGTDSVFALARYNSAGALDQTFGSGGLVTTFDLADNAEAHAIVTQKEGTIVAAGTARNRFALAFYNPLDGGLISTSVATIGGVINGAAVQADDSIVVVGNNDTQGLLARFTPQGVLDAQFGDNGVVTSQGDLLVGNRAVAIDDQQKIVTTGTNPVIARPPVAGVVSVFNSDGSLNKAATLSINPSITGLNAITLQPSNNAIIVAGLVLDGGAPSFLTARYANGLSGGSLLSLAIKAKYC